MAQIVRKADIEAAACHHQKRETDDDTPDNDVYQGFDAAAAWVRELLFHHDTKIRILGGYWKYPLPAKQISVRRSEQNKTQSVLTLTGGKSTLSDATIVIRGAEVLEQGKLIEAVDGANLSVTDVKSKGGLILPGTATPGEMEQAMAFGLEAVKFFPAEQNGGVAKLKAIAGPYKALKWMPTGGVSAKNLMDYLSFDQVVACGGTWMVKKDLIEAENWAEITRLTREAVDTMLGFSLAHVGINCLDAQASERTARTICGLFGLPFRAGNSSNHAGTAVECTKAPGPGVHGHIAIGTNSVERAIYHLERRGVAIDHATCSTTKYQ